MVPKWVHHAIMPIVKSLEKHIPQPYAGEIRGLASYAGGSLSDIIILNFAYEVSAYVLFKVYVYCFGPWATECIECARLMRANQLCSSADFAQAS